MAEKSINPSIFREYDIRGFVGKDLDENTMDLFGKGIGTFLRKESGKKIVVGHDNRKTSLAYAKALCAGMNAVGCDVEFVGLATTPMVYFGVCDGGFDGGICVTASHNPPEFNGLKITAKNAVPVYGAQLQEIREIIDEKKFASGKGALTKKNILADYKKMLAQKIRLLPHGFAGKTENGKKAGKKLRVVLDTGNGMAGMVAPQVLRDWGLEVIEQHTELDSSFPHHLPDPTEEKNVVDLIERVKKEKADLGIGFDGDADRLGIVSGSGKMVFADKLLAILAKDFLARHPNERVLCDVKCSKLVEDIVTSAGGKLVLGKTGHSLIKSKMRQEKILLAGEMSGHIFFADEFFGYDDALYACGRLLRALHGTGKTLDELLLQMPVYFNTHEIRLDCEEKDTTRIVEGMKNFFAKKYPASVTIDGIRIVFGDGWALVRKSNTQAKIILRFEAASQKRLLEIKKEVNQKLCEFFGVQNLKIDE